MVIPAIYGHGTMVDPLQRSSLWREYGTQDFQPNYNDNELFCGGVDTQWKVNNGLCGICGDAFNAEIKDNEAGGKYATGFIAKKYNQGQQIEVKVNLTAAHAGYFEFRICSHNDIYKSVSQECLDQNLLKLAGTQDTQYEPGFLNGQHKLQLQLPKDLTCDQCVLQWHYRAGKCAFK
ncbi:hypothetical protein KUTeg_002376, partial [Tegillarca granosa]